MKKIRTTDIVSTQGAPFLAKTHNLYKESIQETHTDIVKTLLGSYTTNDIMILWGCVVVANIPGTSTITAGAVYYNGEIYQVDANASISTPADTLVWGVVTTYVSGDPVEWSDGVTRSFHQIDKLALSNAASGSGLANYDGATVKRFDSGWIDSGFTPSGDIAAINIDYRKNGSLVFLRGNFTFDAAVGAAPYSLGTLPSGYRPAEGAQYICPSLLGSTHRMVIITVDLTGEIFLQLTSTSTDYNSHIVQVSNISFLVN